MDDLNLTLSKENISELLSGDKNALASLLEPIIQQIIESKFRDYIGTLPYERQDKGDRVAYRNGNRPITMRSTCGTLEIQIPQTRNGHFDPELIKHIKMADQALLYACVEMAKNGVSTRKVKHITNALCGLNISKSEVSRLSDKIKDEVDRFFSKPLLGEYPIILVDAIYISLRDKFCPRKVAVFITIGVHESGYRHILSVDIEEKEGEYNWLESFEKLKARGLKGVYWVVSDAHPGITKAVSRAFLGAVWQRCRFHFTKNVLDKVASKYKVDFAEKLDVIFKCQTKEEAEKLAIKLGDEYENKCPKAVSVLDDGIIDALNFLALPYKYRTKLNTTNIVERTNKEIRRRTNVIGVFVTEQSMKNYVGSVLINVHEKWQARKYIDTADFYLRLIELGIIKHEKSKRIIPSLNKKIMLKTA